MSIEDPMTVEKSVGVSRMPQQGRSRASYDRMLEAAETLMVQKIGDDFTLSEVGQVGKVSVGSIYLRFDSKDDLILAVQARVLARIDEDQTVVLATVCKQSTGLDDFIDRFVHDFAALLERHAPILRPIMLRASVDAKVSAAGSASHNHFAEQVGAAFLMYRDQFGRADHERVVQSTFRMLYSTIARHLGLGSPGVASGKGDWGELKEDMSAMCVAFLRAPPSDRLR